MAKLRNTTSPAVQLSISGGASSGQFKTPGIGPGQSLVINPNADVLVYNEDLEKSAALQSLLDSGKLTKISEEEPLDATSVADESQDIREWILSNDVLIQFTGGNEGKNGTTPNTYGAAASPVTVPLVVTDGDGTTDLLNNVTTVLVTITGGTATSPSIDGSSSPVTKTMIKGTISMSVAGTGPGTVILGLSTPTHPSETLDVTDVATVTLT